MEIEYNDESITKPVNIEASAVVDQARAPCLVILKGKQIGRRVPLIAPQVRIGRADDADLSIQDSSISRYHALVYLDASGTWCVRDLGSTNGTIVNGRRVDEASLHDRATLQLGEHSVIRFELQSEVEGRFFEQLYEAGTHDPLLGVFNRAYLEQHLEADFRLARRHGEPLGLLMIDIDHFKQVNDRHGHLAGDQVLRAISDALVSRLRGEDILARYGGEEFAVILRRTDAAGAQALAESLRQLVEGMAVAWHGAAIALTISVGVATHASPANFESAQVLVAAADQALYLAKQRGRNRVELSTDSGTEAGARQ